MATLLLILSLLLSGSLTQVNPMDSTGGPAAGVHAADSTGGPAASAPAPAPMDSTGGPAS